MRSNDIFRKNPGKHPFKIPIVCSDDTLGFERVKLNSCLLADCENPTSAVKAGIQKDDGSKAVSHMTYSVGPKCSSGF